jgi:hypothetical protein
MAANPVSDDIAAALGAFCRGGDGPTHTALTRVFQRCGYASAAPYVANDPFNQPNKEVRVTETVAAATRDPHRAHELIVAILGLYQTQHFFQKSSDNENETVRLELLKNLQRAFARSDWHLTDDGQLSPLHVETVLSAQGRPAIEAQLKRLRNTSDDAALQVGTAKELLESTAKYVLEAFSVPYSVNTGFDELWHHARDRLGLLPSQVSMSQPAAAQVRELLQSSWTIARMANEIRNDEGTGHGRTLPTGMTSEMALLVVREACSIAQMVLATLDRMTGR